MAIVKVNFVKRDKSQKQRAKAAIRYFQHRPGKDGKKLRRILFGLDGSMERDEAYHMIDDAEKGSLFFRFVLSPDPTSEDTGGDLDLRLIARQMMLQLEETLNKQAPWVGAVHADHAVHRHVHLLAVLPRRLATNDLANLRAAASAACEAQLRERDSSAKLPTKAWEKGGGWELMA
jgi:hypothetical protein